MPHHMIRKDTKEKDTIYQIPNQLDFNLMTQDDLFEVDGFAKNFISRLLNKALGAEMNTHLGYRKYFDKGYGSRICCNDYSEKTVITVDGKAQITIPWDRNSEFEPEILRKHEKRLPEFCDQSISIYSKWVTTRDIQSHLKEICVVNVSPQPISNVTDAVYEGVRLWRPRPLVYLDAKRGNSRESDKSDNQTLYIALAITMERRKKVLGFYLVDNDGVKFCMGNLLDLSNRGAQDIFIACMSGLTGFHDTVRAVFLEIRIQLCIVYMVRNCTIYMSYKNLTVGRNLKKAYSAQSEDEVLFALDEIYKIMYFAIYKTRGKWTQLIRDWRLVLNQFSIVFEGRGNL